MMEELDELRPPTAWRLLEIWRGTRELAEEPLERALLCNAQVLAESCLRQGKPVFPDGAAVLTRLTAGEMETLLRRLAGEEPSPAPAAVNRDFDLGPADGRFVGTASRALGSTGRPAPLRRGRRCGWSWPGSVQNGSIRPPSDRLAPERPPILPGGGIP